MSIEDNKILTRRIMEEGINQRDQAIFEELSSPDFIWRTSSATLLGHAAVTTFLNTFFEAFPDGHFAIEEMIAEANTVVARLTFRATHQGQFMSIAPTGKQVNVIEIAILRFEQGKAVEQQTLLDTFSLMQQLA